MITTRFLRSQHRLLVCMFLIIAAGRVQVRADDDTLVTRLRSHVYTLASQEYEGRYPGTPGNEKAVAYIRDQFTKMGLRPVNDTYTQRFTVPSGVELKGENAVSFGVIVPKPFVPVAELKPMKIGWKTGVDYTPLGFSAGGSVSASLTFVGFGITDKTKNIDDYAGVDVKGRVVIVLTGDPTNYNPHAAFKGTSGMRGRAINAREHGAAGVIFVHPQGDSAEVLVPLQFDAKSSNSGIVIMHARRSSIARFFPKNPDSTLLGAEQYIIKSKTSRSFDLPNTTIAASVGLQTVESAIDNVVGVVPGTERPDEYIVVGAHLDHLGYGDENSLYAGVDKKIHFGADDNASGSAGMMELAAMVAARPLSRSVVFIAFNAEERGLLGSVQYTRTPLIPMEKTVCMINLDMIGRLKDNKLNVQGVGSSSRWKPLLDSINGAFSFTITTTDDGLGPSDHSSFYAKEKPVLFFFTGLHSDYHRPSDTPDKINYPGQASVVRFTESVLRTIGSWSAAPEYVKVKSTQSASAGFNVVFGVIPDYADHPKGLHITGVREGGPA
ncbi:MAG: M28 family peptidase, partial [Candidatus Kapaibacterium sp.]